MGALLGSHTRAHPRSQGLFQGNSMEKLLEKRMMRAHLQLNHTIYGSRFQAHVLVGTAASSLKLSHNPCAKALSLAAGPGLQRECSTKGPVNVGDIAEVGPGNLNCRAVYFSVCSQWSGGRGEKVHPDLLTVYIFF